MAQAGTGDGTGTDTCTSSQAQPATGTANSLSHANSQPQSQPATGQAHNTDTDRQSAARQNTARHSQHPQSQPTATATAAPAATAQHSHSSTDYCTLLNFRNSLLLKKPRINSEIVSGANQFTRNYSETFLRRRIELISARKRQNETRDETPFFERVRNFESNPNLFDGHNNSSVQNSLNGMKMK